MRRALSISVLVAAAGASGWLPAQTDDPRTAAGQLAVCGGATAWQGLGFLEFEVTIDGPPGKQGPYLYRWDRRYGFFRLTGSGPEGEVVDLALDIGSGTGGGWQGKSQLSGAALERTVKWALQRFREDVLWLTFPLDWGAPGVTVEPVPDIMDSSGTTFFAVRVGSAIGSWLVRLDRGSGRIVHTVLERSATGRLSVTWSEWRASGGVLFAGRRTIAETSETVTVEVRRALAESPNDAF